MKKTKASRVSVRDIAAAAKVSKTTVGKTLQNQPGVSKSTRERIIRIARKLGYAPDARVASVMQTVRKASSKDLLPIAWINPNPDRDVWQKYKFVSPYWESAQERAYSLGYRLEQIWTHQPGLTISGIAKNLYVRGIEGVIVSDAATHLRLNWNHLAGVTLSGVLAWPRLHRVSADVYFNLMLALKMVRRQGYRRIGICLTEYLDRSTMRSVRAVAGQYYLSTPRDEKIPALIYWDDDQVAAWLRQYRPDAVVCHSSKVPDFAASIGLRVPEDLGVVHIATDDDVSDWAGVCAEKREIGAAAVELVVSLIRSRQFGVPKTVRTTLVRGTWHPGRTLLMPKPGLQIQKRSEKTARRTGYIKGRPHSAG